MGCVTGEMQLGLGASWCSQAWCIAAAPTPAFSLGGDRCRVHYLSTAAATLRTEPVRRKSAEESCCNEGGSRAENSGKSERGMEHFECRWRCKKIKVESQTFQGSFFQVGTVRLSNREDRLFSGEERVGH